MTFNEKLISLDTRLRELRKELEDDLKPYYPLYHKCVMQADLDEEDLFSWEEKEHQENKLMYQSGADVLEELPTREKFK